MVEFSRIWREGNKRQLLWRDGEESGVYEYDSRTTTDDEAADAVRRSRDESTNDSIERTQKSASVSRDAGALKEVDANETNKADEPKKRVPKLKKKG